MTQKIRQDIIIGRNIRKFRRAMDLTQDELCDLMSLRGCELSRSCLSHIEHGDMNIKVSELFAICDIFGIDFNTLFSDLTK